MRSIVPLLFLLGCSATPSLPEAGPEIAPPPRETTVTLGPSAAAPTGGAIFEGNSIRMFQEAAEISYPIIAPVGCAIVQWSLRAARQADLPVARALLLVNEDGAKNELDIPAPLVAGTQTVVHAVNARVMAERDYEIRVQRATGIGADFLFWAAVTYACP